jgi:DNA-binding LacI/PurR family transcriptional regulator
MIKCIHCGQVHAILKAGKVRGVQRYRCKDCDVHFTIPANELKEEKPNKKTGATIHDIANALKISVSTVSKALNNKPDISATTTEEVLAMAKKLNYRPNLLAKNLVNSRSYTIGVIAPSIGNFFFPTIISGIQEIASSRNYNILVCLSHESYETEVNNCKLLMAHRVDGVIMSITAKTKNADHIKELQRQNIPVVFVNRAADGVNASRVSVNDYAGAVTVVEHLIAQGCKKIAHIAGPQNLVLSKERLKGYLDTLKKHHLPIKDEWIVYNDLWMENSKKCVNQLLSVDDKPDAIFAYTDFVGIELIIAAKAKGIKIPEDISVVGFSNDPVSEIVDPGLTTLSQPPLELGKLAAEILISHIENESGAFEIQTKSLEIDLIKRKSSDKNGLLKASL